VEIQDLDDGAVARRVAGGGDTQAEAELYKRLARRVRLYGLRHLRDAQAAADLVQTVMLTTLVRLRAGEVREPEKIASFVLGMCRMTVLEIRRGSKRREELLEKWAPAYAGATAEAAGNAGTTGDAGMTYEAPEPRVFEAERLAGCLEALAERERSVVLLTFFADKAGDEVAKELGLSAGNVRVIRHRALGRLRECMGARGE
jgi:RNA polymerase sigma-70 factor (ECF subfamily)